jgi:hypothetical protein
MKRLKTKTAPIRLHPSSPLLRRDKSNFGATRLDALLPAILDRAFKGEL